MSISRQTLTVVIVTFKSDQVIDDCIQSISNQIKIIVVDNSNDQKFKENIEKKYQNVNCILSSKNLGMGSGNNLGLRHVETDFAMILNPDVILEKNTIQEIIDVSKKIDSFAILAPLSSDKNYPNYKLNETKADNINDNTYFKVKSVDGFAMVLNLKKINQHKSFQNYQYFDENFFMYLENDDLCKRIIENGENIYIIKQAKINHLGAKAVNKKYAHEVELSRNWHWMWSKFYFNKKHFGFVVAIWKEVPNFLSSILKYLLYKFLFKNKKKEMYLQRVLGFTHAFLGKNSSYRPKINN
jgi:N-acetylglucosaminyl-diphospho-decaprenol L-rhamnosyltransferase